MNKYYTQKESPSSAPVAPPDPKCRTTVGPAQSPELHSEPSTEQAFQTC